MAEERIHRTAAIGFDRGADAYERARPSYPPEAVELLVDRLALAPARRVLDLAAGTGKMTRLLAPTGAEVVAVEPVSGMRHQLRRAVPGIEVQDGTAEALPLADGSVDAVVCAQAWHWFDGPAALAEVRRVLKPGGGLAVVFNIRDESVPWVRRLSEISEFHRGNRPHHRVSRAVFADQVRADGGFGPVEVFTFRFAQELDEDLLVDRAASQSNVASMDEDGRRRVLNEVRELARTHPALAGRATFELPYQTEVALCARR